MANTSTCPGCKVVLPLTDYPADNRYGVVSAECRQIFDAILVYEGKHYGYPPVHRLIIDAYGVQHPPHAEIQQQLNISPRFIAASIQSIAIHLIALYLAIEKKQELRSIAGSMDRVLKAMNQRGIQFEQLEPPLSLGSIRAVDVHSALVSSLSQEEYSTLAWQWAHAAWDAWAQHHDKVRDLYKKYA